MPPTSNVRKSSLAENPSTSAKRTASGRAIRTNTTRPTNYYARPFGSVGGASATQADHGAQDAASPGFFPALQYFSDAVTALPREVIKQFTQMKEVEAKIHSSHEKLGEAVDGLMELPLPPRKSTNAQATAGGQQQGLLSLTANNSISGSTSASLVNGMAGSIQQSARNSVSGSVAPEDNAQYETEEEIARRKQYLDLRILTHNLLPILDEKNVVLAEANRVLSLQMMRVDSVLPHIDNEISEEARLGSMTHWAYSDNRQKKGAVSAAPAVVANNRRDVAATNSLAAAANAIHETEIAQARQQAGREATKEKHGKGKRAAEHVDSDFDERPKKTHAKVAKSKAAGHPLTGLGINTNGEPVKKRRVDKSLAAPMMERSMSANTGKGRKAVRETPRSTPAVEPKKTKPKPAATQPKKPKAASSVQNSPALASSPLHSSFIASNMEPPPGARPQSARLRNNSTATNLRHEKLADDDSSRPPSANAKTNGNGEKSSVKRKRSQDEDGETTNIGKEETDEKDKDKDQKREEAEAHATTERPPPSRTTSGSGKQGRGSNTGTPRNESFTNVPAAMVRTRSQRGSGRDSSSAEPQFQGRIRNHRRAVSNSHILKQLAPFNRSPDLDRHKDDEDGDDDGESLDGRDHREPIDEPRPSENRAVRSAPTSRPVSRRNTQSDIQPPSPTPAPREEELEVEEPPEQEDEEEEEDGADDTQMVEAEVEEPELEPETEQAVPDLEEDDESEHDPDDPNEIKYCYCNRGSYGEMVACDNDNCPREWFHIGCTELKESPGEDETWYCNVCRPLFSKKRGGKGKAGR